MSEPTQDEKRELIANACNWPQPNYSPGVIWMPDESGENGLREVDPFTDLNACHEMEKQAGDDFAHSLRVQVSNSLGIHWSMLSDNYLVSAPARDRAEAFGINRGLW